MKTHVEDDLGNWTPPPLDPETEARLRAAGVRLATGRFNPDWEPLPKRPAWLAFLLRTFHRVVRLPRTVPAFFVDQWLRLRQRIREKTQPVDAGCEDWVAPPLDEETKAQLRAMGVRLATNPSPNWDFQPLPKRPRWFAFLMRLLRIPPE
jgi:broad specificity phosphatase PhoE